ncbi:MAG TPA: Calx-beta domain-containing protein, partial [Candidatus Dormibacteraeota bacterium]|nr:Calx-beta domain-containing protein [Candidatus Dormibacteraeota bacterium]
NDAGGIIQFSATNYTVTEAGPAARITLIRTSGLAGAVGVDFHTAGATALAGSDYLEVVTNIVFATNETSKTILIPILNDATVEPAEKVQLSLSNPTGGGSLGPRSTATLTILDNDVGGAINFSTAAYSVSENGGLATITVNRSGGTAEVSVAYSTLDGTAVPDLDYVATSGTLVFGSNIFKQTFQVQINDNSDAGGNKTVLLQLSDPVGGAALGTTRAAVLTIKDDEINVQGVYNVSGSLTAGGCTLPEDNVTRTFTGQVRFTDQVNHDFLGTATLLSSTGQAIEATNISATFDSAGKISGTYDWNNDNGDYGSGTLNGTITGTNLQISFHGSEAPDAGDTCQHNGSLAGKLYVSPANGVAPADLQSASLTAGIVFSGALNAGTFYFDSAGPDTYDFEPVNPDSGVYSYGLYLYTRTGPNTASLKLVDTGEGLY